MAVTIWPRRLIRPLTAGGASGTRVMLLVADDLLHLEHVDAQIQLGRGERCSTGTRLPGLSPPRRRAAPEPSGASSERMIASTSSRSVTRCWITAEPNTIPCRAAALHRQRLLDDVEDAVHDEADAAAAVRSRPPPASDRRRRVCRRREAPRGGAAGGSRRGTAPPRPGRCARPSRRGTPRAGPPCESGIAIRRLSPRPQTSSVWRVTALPPPSRRSGRPLWSLVPAITPGVVGQPEHVEDQGHPAVAHDRGAGERGDALELLAERLDDDLLGVVDLVDDQAELPVVGLQHDDVDRRRAGAAGALDAELAVEVDQRQQVAAQAVDRRAVDRLDAVAAPARPRGAPARAG